ncbi:hypothetical protein GCM10027347_59830 [Larkinella harenae]
MTINIDALANEIRRIDGSNTLGAGQLAEGIAAYLALRSSTPCVEPMAKAKSEPKGATMSEESNDTPEQYVQAGGIISALEFYADTENYIRKSMRDGTGSFTNNLINEDCGQRARQALTQRPPAPPSEVMDIDALHSKIDMDIEDETGCELSLEDSRLTGLAIRKALTQRPPAPTVAAQVDLEALKKDTSNAQELYAQCLDREVGEIYGWNACIDHLAAKGIIGQGVPYCGCGDPIPEDDLRCDTCQLVQWQVTGEKSVPQTVLQQVSAALHWSKVFIDNHVTKSSRLSKSDQIKCAEGIRNDMISKAYAALQPYLKDGEK